MLSFVLSFMVLIGSSSMQERGPLYGMVVIIDPGHGGVDQGAHGFFGDVEVVEDEYCYDVALRLRRIVQDKGGIAIVTTRDKKQFKPNASPAQEVISSDRNEVFRNERGARVVAGVRGLSQRTEIANMRLIRHPRHRVVFVSIHFDNTGNGELEGVHLIAPKGESMPQLVTYLEEEFRKESRLRNRNGEEYHPVVRSGDRRHGMRDLFVLRASNNSVRQRVLIELGNFSNPSDVWRIRNYRVRENYAQIIIRALIRVNQLPLAQVRN